MTRRLIPLAAGFVSGLFSAFYICVSGGVRLLPFALLCLFAALIGLLASVLRLRFRPRVMLFCAAFAAAAAYSGVYTSLRLLPLEELDGSVCQVEGTVESIGTGDGAAVLISGRVNGLPAKINVYINDFGGERGDSVILTAKVKKLENSPYFRGREYYLPDGVMLGGTAQEILEITPGGNGPAAFIRSYSERVSQNLRRIAGGEEGELLAAMVTGDRSAFSDGLRLKLNRAGVGHLAAVSGLHVSVVAAAVMLLLRRLHAPRWLAALLTEVCIAGFIVFAGLRASAVRAGIMLSIAVLGSLVRRKSDPANTVCLCALLMTLPNPYAAGDSSLMLSLSGAFGAAVMSKGLSDGLKLHSEIAGALCVSACAAFATAPFAALWFDELSLLSPFTNLFAIPVCSAALVIAMAYAATGCAFPLLVKAAAMLCKIVIFLCAKISALNFGCIPLGDGGGFFAFTAAASVCLAVWLIYRKPRVTAVLTAMALAFSLMIVGVSHAAEGERIQLFAVNYSDSSGLVLRKGAECIIIDFGGAAQAAETVVSRYGISRVRGVVLLEDGEAGYAAYSELAVKPDRIYLSDNAYIFGGGIETADITDGSELLAFGCRLKVSKKLVEIDSEGGGATVSKGFAADGEGLKISFLNGVTVIENEEIYTYNGDILQKYELGEG